MELPAWNIESEYPSIDSVEFTTDESKVLEYLAQLKTLRADHNQALEKGDETDKLLAGLQSACLIEEEFSILYGNLRTYLHCQSSNDTTLQDSKAKSSVLKKTGSDFMQQLSPFHLFLTKASDEFFQKFIAHPKLKPSSFFWRMKRENKAILLSEKEESLLIALSPSGFTAWSELYDNLGGTMRVEIEKEGKPQTIGLSEAHALTRGADATLRKSAWQGIQKAWKTHAESAAGILNSLAGWRLETLEKRSHTKKIDHLYWPLWDSRIEKATLNAMMTAVERNKADIQQAAFLMAKFHGQKQLHPWDLLAPAPLKTKSPPTDFKAAAQMIKKSFQTVDQSFGDFVDTMVDNNWIETRVLPNKKTGGYCTGFAKSRTPRIFMTYMGSTQDISTLAHEIGHAYHSWVMRDLPEAEQEYPMTLAETASIFAETVMGDALLAQAKTKEEILEFGWADLEGSVSLLLNISARYEFESKFYEKRKERALSVEELSQLMDEAWAKWYGPTLTENDKMFWAHKLHFAIAGTSFYNFPYIFGYLFSLSIYARREEYGADFMKKYIEILRDTGRMTAEELVQKHLGEDIRRPEFWQKSIDVVKQKIKHFEKALS